MSVQIKFFDKSKVDLSFSEASITITDAVATDTGQTFVDFLRNRNNNSAWMTTGSTDAANTTLDVDMSDDRFITNILLISHNLKAYTIKYWNGASFVDFSPAISVTGNTDPTTDHTFTEVETDKIQIIITEAMVVDADKFMRQLIVTNKVAAGQLEGWPVIKKPRFNLNKKITTMLSGKVNVIDSVGGFQMDLEVRNWNKDADLTIVEEIHFGRRGVIVWLSGGDEAQFSHERIGYRREDVFLMRAVNDYGPEWASGIYSTGMKISLKMREAIN